MAYRLKTGTVEVEDIDTLEMMYAIEAINEMQYHLRVISDEFYPRFYWCQTDKTLTDSRKAVYAVGADLKRVLRGRSATSALGQNLLSPIVIEMIEWVVGQYIKLGIKPCEKEDHLLRLASRLRSHLSPSYYITRTDESYYARELENLFDELEIWTKELLEYMTDYETYLMGGWDVVLEMLGCYDGHAAKTSKPEFKQGVLFEEDSLLIF